MSVPFTYRGKITAQQIKNEYFFEHLEEINKHMVKFDKTFEWKESMINTLVGLVGWPVKLSRWQNFLAKFFMQ